MNDQLKAIIEKIKQDGVKNAGEQAAEIISKAKEEAKQILADAENEKKTIIESARKETKTWEQNGKSALGQAGRDIILHIRKQIAALYDSVIKDQIKQEYDTEAVARALSTVMKNWSASEYKTLDILLPEKELERLKGSLEKALADALASGAAIKASNENFDGFRVSEKNGSYYYDFSSDAIAGLFSEYLTADISEIMKKAAEDIQ